MKHSSGFTYLELLIVLVLLSITSVLIGGAFDFVRQTRERAVAMEALEEGVIMRSLFREWLEELSSDPSQSQFTGSPNKMSFILNGTLRAKPDILRLFVSFSILNEAGRTSARIELTGYDADNIEVFFEMRQFEPSLTEATILYYGSVNGAPISWHRHWDEISLPRLIRFDATRTSSEPVAPLIVRPSATYDQSFISAFFPSPPT